MIKDVVFTWYLGGWTGKLSQVCWFRIGPGNRHPAWRSSNSHATSCWYPHTQLQVPSQDIRSPEKIRKIKSESWSPWDRVFQCLLVCIEENDMSLELRAPQDQCVQGWKPSFLLQANSDLSVVVAWSPVLRKILRQSPGSVGKNAAVD